MKKIKIAIIGAGAMAEKYLQVLKTNRKIILSGIFSRTFLKAENLKKKFKIKKNIKKFEKLFSETNADIVISTVSVDQMYKTTLKLIKYPWLIFIEKPPGLNYQEYKKLLKFANLSKKKIFVGMNRRYLSSTLDLIKSLRKERSKRSIFIFDQQDINIQKKNNRPRKVLYYWMYANSIHLIDYANFLCRGQVKKIDIISRYKKEIHCKIKFNSKDNVNYICRWNKPGPWQIKVSTDNSYYELSPLENLKIKTGYNKNFVEYLKSKNDNVFKPGLKKQVDELINIFLNKRSNLPELKDLKLTMSLINKIYGR